MRGNLPTLVVDFYLYFKLSYFVFDYEIVLRMGKKQGAPIIVRYPNCETPKFILKKLKEKRFKNEFVDYDCPKKQ